MTRTEKYDVIIKVALLILAALVLTFVSCNTEKRALEKTQLYLFKHPEFSAGYCAEQFPDKPDSVVVKETETKFDTLLYQDIVLDTVNVHDTLTITKTQVKVVTKTVRRDSIIYRENKAEQRRLELALLACQDNNNAWLNKYTEQENLTALWEGRAKKRWWLIFALIGGAVVYTGLKIKKILV